MDIRVYNPNKRSVVEADIHTWAKANSCDFVIEFHMNSDGNPQANGYETLVDYNQGINNITKALHSSLVKFGWRDRGVKYCNGGGGRDLQNPRLMRSVKINYALVELGFLSNQNDVNIFNRQIPNIPKVIYDICKQNGVKTLGIVYGHGNKDVGAVNSYGIQEAVQVRKLNFNNIGKEDELDMTKAELNKLLDDRDKQLVSKILRQVETEIVKKGETKNHWADLDFNELNEFLSKNEISIIADKRHNDLGSRGENIRMLNLVRKAIQNSIK